MSGITGGQEAGGTSEVDHVVTPGLMENYSHLYYWHFRADNPLGC